jgi:hypothetical protein
MEDIESAYEEGNDQSMDFDQEQQNVQQPQL